MDIVGSTGSPQAGDLPVILMVINPDTSEIDKTYLYANSQILAQYDGDYTADKYFYLHDRLGSVRQVIDAAGAVIEGVADFHNALLNFFR